MLRTFRKLRAAALVAALVGALAGVRSDPAAAQSRCTERTLLGRHAYSICEADKHWHVVTDSYFCIPNDGVETKRTYDKKTDQECDPKKLGPSSVEFGLKLLLEALRQLDTSCQSPQLIGDVTIFQCVANFWELATYAQYECLDHSLRTQRPATKIVRTKTECEKPPPKATDFLAGAKKQD